MDTQPPLNLYKAHVALWLRITELMQEGRQRWLEQATRTIGENIQETRAANAQLHDGQDLQALAALPGHAAWRVLTRQMVGLQAVAQTALSNQTQAAAGWQHAVAAWQQELARSLDLAGDAMPLNASLREWVQRWSPLPSAVAEQAPQAPAKETSHG